MCGGGGGNQTVRNVTELSPEQREILAALKPILLDYAKVTPKDFPGEKIAPFSQNELAARHMMRELAIGDRSKYTYTPPEIQKYKPNFSPALQTQIDKEKIEDEKKKKTLTTTEATKRWLSSGGANMYSNAAEWAKANGYTLI